MQIKTWAQIALLTLGASTLTALTGPAVAAPGTARLTIVQALPDATAEVSLDGRSLRSAGTGTVIGPVSVTPGEHRLTFAGIDGGDVTTTVSAEAGGNTDVVLHLPAEPEGAPRVSTYEIPDGRIASGKARVLIAHTATVAAADIVVDGKVIFENVANGEYASADVPAGDREAAIYPTGTTQTALFGPATLPLRPRTLTMTYAYGDPAEGTMALVSHALPLRDDGSVAPTRISTGSAGLAGAASDFGWVADGPRLQASAVLAAQVGGGALIGALLWQRRRRMPPAVPGGARRAGVHRA